MNTERNYEDPERQLTRVQLDNLYVIIANVTWSAPSNPHRQKWIEYLAGPDASVPMLSDSQRWRLELTEYMRQKRLERRDLFHLTLTYKPYKKEAYTADAVNRFFSRFYTHHFLPSLLRTKRFNTKAKRAIQPICIAFLDRHSNVHSPERLHHHAILAVHPDTLDRIQSLTGTNTFTDGKGVEKVMTSDLRECDEMRLLYSSKMFKQYPEFLMFPDRLSH